MESVHDILEGFLRYDDRKDIDAHQCSIDVIELYSDHTAVRLDASDEIILEEYKRKYELKEMPSAHVTCPLTAATLAGPPSDRPSPSKNFGERARRLINERGAAAASTDNKCMVVSENRPAEAEPPPQPSTFLDAAFYLKLQATLEVFFLGMGCLHTTVPVQRFGQPHVQARKRSKRQQFRGGNSRGSRRRNVRGRQINHQFYHTTSLSRYGQEDKIV